MSTDPEPKINDVRQTAAGHEMWNGSQWVPVGFSERPAKTRQVAGVGSKPATVGVRRDRVGKIILGAIAAVFVVGFVALQFSSKASPSPGPTRAATFIAWANGVKRDLSDCKLAVEGMTIDLSKMDSSTATQSDFLTGSVDSKKDVQLCQANVDAGITNFVTGTGVPDGYPSLASMDTELELWADPLTTKVINDIGAVGNSGGSNATVASLIADSQTADGQVPLINADMAKAAREAGVAHWTGLGLPEWGIYQK